MKKRPERLSEVAELAVSLERAGDWEAAVQQFTVLFWGAVQRADVEQLVDAVRGQARVRRQQEQYEEALELADLSREIAMLHGLRQAAARALNLLAVISYSQRDWARARALYKAAVPLAQDVGDDELIGLICQNLGVLANILGNLREARAFYLESIGSFVRTGNRTNAALAYNNLGMACSDLKEWMEAEIYFERGIEIAEQISDAWLLGKLSVNRVEPLIQVGNLPRAKAAVERAAAVGLHVNDRRVLADVARFRGMIAQREGDFRAARNYLEKAVTLAAEARLELEEAEALEELASLAWEEGDAAGARAMLKRAGGLFHALGAERDSTRVAQRLGQWRAGNTPKNGCRPSQPLRRDAAV